MGKGDVKTKRGKIWRGSFGNSRKRKSKAKPMESIPAVVETPKKPLKK